MQINSFHDEKKLQEHHNFRIISSNCKQMLSWFKGKQDGTASSWLSLSCIWFLALLHRTGRIMTSGLSWGLCLFLIVFCMTKGKFFPPVSEDTSNITQSTKRLCHWAGTLHWGAWTTPAVTRPFRWWTRGGWHDTSRPTSWRMRKRSGTPATDGNLTCWTSEPGFQSHSGGKKLTL